MKQMERLSYTMFSSWEQDPTEWYLKYIVGAPRLPQTEPMSIGSAFDAYIKNYLFARIFGSVAPEYELEAIFEAQVEPHNRDFGWTAGAYVFDEYVRSGRAAYLLSLMEQSDSAPVFERKLTSTVDVLGTEIPMTGYPDLRFVSSRGIPVIVDWKVNGFCSKSSITPEPGYVHCVDGPSWDGRASKVTHPKAVVRVLDGITYSNGPFKSSWKDQLTMYNWMLGGALGRNAILMIEQVAGGKQVDVRCTSSGPRPPLRFANHACLVGACAQETLAKRILHMWLSVQSGYIFRSLSRADNDAKVAQLEKAYGNDPDGVFSALTRTVRNY
jgi:hypothetical protein